MDIHQRMDSAVDSPGGGNKELQATQSLWGAHA
jgi:hypothetical protein